MSPTPLDVLALNGLEPRDPQVWNGVRLVPLVRPAPRDDLRIGLRKNGAARTSVDLGGRPGAPNKTSYTAYIPHGLVVDWTKDGAQAAGETTMEKASAQGRRDRRLFTVDHRMIRREKRGPQNRLRLLPLHVAMEGFLDLHFGGPTIAWPVYSDRVLRRGLTPRFEWTLDGHGVPDLREALSLFEIHDGQCGMLIFVGGALASATVVSHPADYRAMHRSLIDDFYGPMLYWFGRYAAHAPPPPVKLDDKAVDDFAGLHAELKRVRAEWGHFELRQASGLIGRPVVAKRAYAMGPFDLMRFDTGLEPHVANHIGEAIVRDDGTLEYLKTYRLDRDQCRRGFYLRHLAAHDWHLPTAAAALKQTPRALRGALKKSGLRWLLHGGLKA